MADQSIKPALPITRTADVLKKKKNPQPRSRLKRQHPTPDQPPRKGHIDTYA